MWASCGVSYYLRDLLSSGSLLNSWSLLQLLIDVEQRVFILVFSSDTWLLNEFLVSLITIYKLILGCYFICYMTDSSLSELVFYVG
jgi:hypothetical protein